MNKRRALIRKQNESKKELKQNERRQKRENVVEVIDLGRFFELAATNIRYFSGLILHAIENDMLENYTGDFVLIGSMLIDELEQKTSIRCKNIYDFKYYNNSIDNGGYDSEDVFFTD